MKVLRIVYVVSIFLISKSLSSKCTTTRTGNDVFTDCHGRAFRNVPRNIPNDTTYLDMSDNKLPIILNFSFSGLKHVSSLKLLSAQISVIESKAFSGLVKLTSLDLSKNFLGIHSLPDHVFDSSSVLRILDLSQNYFRHYPEKVLEKLSNLERLSINGINNQIFGNGFRSLRKLIYLNFDPCIITRIDNNTFDAFKNIQLKELILECKITYVEAGALSPFQSLESLDISMNLHVRVSNLLELLNGLMDRNITSINFRHNFRTSAATDVLLASQFSMLGAVCVKEVDLTRNQISVIQAGGIHLMKHKHCLEKLILKENEISGERTTLLEMAQLINLRWLDISNQATILVKTKVKKNKYYGRRLDITGTKYSSGRITYYFQLPHNLQYLDISYIGVKGTGLSNINLTNADKLDNMNLAGNKFKHCLGHFYGLPHLQTIDISDFNCSYLDLNMISFMPNLKTLISRRTHLNVGLQNDINGDFLKQLFGLRHIDFSDNGFITFNQNMFISQYRSLISLDLSKNKFSKFPIHISKFSNLMKLSLVQNQIALLQKSDMNQLENYQRENNIKFELLLNDNHFVCNCDSIDFVKWLQETKVTLDENRNYSCVYIDNSLKSTVYAYKHLEFIESKCLSKTWLNITIILVVVILFIFTSSSIAYKYRITLHFLHLHIRRKYRHYTALEGDSKEYKYNAFVAYCNEDEEWVCGPLVNYLEKTNGLALCLHDRDFAAGKLIMDNIIDAIFESKKVVLVISHEFLKSSWCEFELDMARMKMFQDNRDMLVVVLLDKLSTSQMPISLQRIWNKVTCLEVDETICTNQNDNFEHLFWKRLYEAVVM
ncbi:toll-like receptor 4 [Mytilus californianus]|uniref:toll-like receptor 4 n=1 Tax=Mytilus californianus TaxID=6549 RepID=UPI002247BEA4|nr:toll-like receptor 4 [Mytilus californianus]